MADASRHSMFFVEETAYSVTPTNPALQTLRHTGTTLGLSKNTTLSEELRADRQIRNFRHGTKQVGGDISTELSYETFNDLIEAVLLGTWGAGPTPVLKAGTTRRSFTIVRQFSDLDPGEGPIHRFEGVEFDTWNLSLVPDGIVQSTFGIVGRRQNTPVDAFPIGSTFPPASTKDPFDSFTGAIEEGGSPIAIVTEIAFTLENAIQARFVIGSDETIRPMIGRSNLSGQMTVYFEDAILLSKFIDETSSTLKFTLVKGADNYEFFMPRITYNAGQPDVQGQSAVTLTMPFQALYDDAEATNLKITRSSV